MLRSRIPSLPLLIFAHALLLAPAAAYSQQDIETFHGTIKYLGGVGFPDFKGHESWDNSLTITPDSVLMTFAEAFHPRSFAVADITNIEYGQAATRHVGRWVALGILVAPIALFGIFHKQRHHFVTVSYAQGGQELGVYFEANKDVIRDVLNTLSYRSKKPIHADDDDRKWLMTEGVAAVPEGASVGKQAAVTVPSAGPASPSPAIPDTGPPVHKGLNVDEVQRILGSPVSFSRDSLMTKNLYLSAGDTVEVDYVNGVAVDVQYHRSGTNQRAIHKGMSRVEVTQAAGAPFDSTSSGQITTLKYHWQDGVLEADFVNDVLVGYRIASN